jgi:hypothetical protein
MAADCTPGTRRDRSVGPVDRPHAAKLTPRRYLRTRPIGAVRPGVAPGSGLTQEALMSTTPDTMSEPMDPTMTGEMDGLDDWIESPVDDATYDLLMALASKLEAIDTYRVYASDGSPELWRELAADERRHADRLVEALRERFGSE